MVPSGIDPVFCTPGNCRMGYADSAQIDALQQRIKELERLCRDQAMIIRATEAAIHDDVIDGAAGPHCQEYWDYTVRSHYPYNGARDLHTEHTDDWQAAYNRLTALLQQRFPPQDQQGARQ